MAQSLDMDGKVVLITGATNGIGMEAAIKLAETGATVVLVGRNRERTEGVALEIREKTGSSRVDFLLADLSAQAQVHQLADQFKARYDRLDVLINNAGAIFMKREESVDGIEMTFALNHLAYFLLTNLLLDVLQASAPARIINVSSGAHEGARFDLDDLETRQGYSGFKAYSRSKLANVLFTYELAHRLEGTGVTANVLHPGFVATNFGVSNGGVFWPVFKLIQLMALKPEAGARTTIYLATAPKLETVSGKYFDRQKPVQSSPASYDRQLAEQLWEASLRMTNLVEKV